MLTKKELDEIRARCEAATPGPWRYDGQHNEIKAVNYVDVVNETFGRDSSRDDWSQADEFGHLFVADFDFIAYARQDVPNLLEHIESQNVMLAGMENALRLSTCESGKLRAALRQVEPLCRKLIRAVYGVDDCSDVTQCKICHAKFRSWLNDKHTEKCVFALLEGSEI